MRGLAALCCVLAVLLAAPPAGATDRTAIAIEGSYLLTEEDSRQRVLSLSRGGNVIQLSDQQAALGFTTGLGTWELSGPKSARVIVVDFMYDLGDRQPIGPAIIVYDLTFSDAIAGHYDKVSGSYKAEQFAQGQNPLSPEDEPIRTHKRSFEGQRITAK